MPIGFPGSLISSLNQGGSGGSGPFIRDAGSARITPAIAGDWLGFPSPATTPSTTPVDQPFLLGDGASGAVNLSVAFIDAGGVARTDGVFAPDVDGSHSLGAATRRWGDLFAVDGEFTGLLTVKNPGATTPTPGLPQTKLMLVDDTGTTSAGPLIESHAYQTTGFGNLAGILGFNESATLGTKFIGAIGIFTHLDENTGLIFLGAKKSATDPDITPLVLLNSQGNLQITQNGASAGLSIGGSTNPLIYNNGADLVVTLDGGGNAFLTDTADATFGKLVQPWFNGFFVYGDIEKRIDFANQAAVPDGSPAAGYGRLWAKTDKTLHYTDEDGTDYDLTAAGASTWTRNATSTSLDPSTLGDAVGFNSASTTGNWDKPLLRGVGASDTVQLELTFKDSLGNDWTGSMYPGADNNTDLGLSSNIWRDIYSARNYTNVVEAPSSQLTFKTTATQRMWIEADGKVKRAPGSAFNAVAMGGIYDIDVFTHGNTGGAVVDLFKSQFIYANSLDTDGDSLTIVAFGYDIATTNQLDVQLLGAGSVFTYTFPATDIHWKLVIEIVRENSATAKYCVTLVASDPGDPASVTAISNWQGSIGSIDWTVTNFAELYCNGNIASGANETAVTVWRVEYKPSPLSFI